MTYRAPVSDIVFTMRHVAGFDRAVADGVYGDLSADLAETILEEAGRFANDVIAPLNREGDRHGVVLKDGEVDAAATEALRTKMRADRGEISTFNFGPNIEDLRARCLEETGLPAPIQPRWQETRQEYAEAAE